MRRDQRGSGDVILLLVVLLVAALMVIGLLGRAWSKANDRATTAEANLITANAATQTCNDSIAGLEAAAVKRGELAATKRAQAQAKRQSAEVQAQQILSTPATVPGDDCRSAQDRVTKWLQGRKKP